MYRIILLLLVVAAVAGAAVYNVGPAQPYSAIGDVPLESLSAGDSVRIHYRTTHYREKWVIGAQGTATDPVVFIGVPDGSGNLPVIAGNNAITRTALDYWNEDRGVIKIGGASTPSTAPAHIFIETLDIRCGRPPYTFSDDIGSSQTYRDNAASIHVEATIDAAPAQLYTAEREYLEHQSSRKRIDRGDISAFDYVADAAFLQLTLCLQGAYDVEAFMRNGAPALLPLDSPYESAAKRIDPLPDDVVDWILVELRTAPAAAPAYQYSFLLAGDGGVFDVMNENRIEPVRLENIIEGDYHIALKHRNHKSVVSAQSFGFSLNEIISISFCESPQIYHDAETAVSTPTGWKVESRKKLKNQPG